MQEQMKQQFDQFQNGFKAMFGIWPKMAEPALRSSEVVIDSLSQLTQDQFQFARSCLDIGRRQMESVAQGNDVTALFRNQGAVSEYYSATLRYSDALRQNAERTLERMAAIGREATDIAREATDEATSSVNQKAAKANQKAASTHQKAANA